MENISAFENENIKKKKKRWWIIPIVILVILLAAGYMGHCKAKELIGIAKEAKTNAEEAVRLFVSKDYDGSSEKLNAAHDTLKYFRSLAENEKIYKIGCKLPKYGEDFRNACILMDIADDTLDKWADRSFDLLKSHPIDEIVKGESYDIKSILAYLDFAEEAVPDVERILSEISAVKLSFFDIEAFINGYRDDIDELLDLYHQAEYYFPLIHAALGDGSDKYFLIIAQNTAEIRPCGGFPGSIGTIAIKDGTLTVGNFDSVWLVFPNDTPSYLMPESSINNLFNGFFIWPRDAEFCPDFEFLSSFWATMYEHEHGIKPDGIISMTPAIIQDLLAVFGGFEVSNGDVIDGSNAVRLLQHDWYVRYMNASQVRYGIDPSNDLIDDLFEETAKGALAKIFDNLDLDNIPKLFEIIEKRANDRVFMLWLNGEEEENLVRSYGFSGGLNSNPEEPAIGIFFGNDYGAKLGWWIDADTTISEGKLRSDERMEYDVTVTFRNTFNRNEIYSLGYWIVGKRMTAVLSWYVYAFAPAEGTISGMTIDNWISCPITTYNGLQVGYKHQYYINPGSSSVVRFKVCTAPGVTVKPAIYRTPTLTEYR